ncbi:MAG: serine/threonine-protein kinase, partial [Gemmatimonadales bacterium]
RYQLDCPIGRGAMGVVFRARDVGEARTVALKVMRPAIGFEDGVVERFRLEGQAMAQLRHDHIVRVHARGESGAILWFTMDLVDGPSLARLIKEGPTPWPRAADLIAQAADALAYAHRCGVIHRDIKPSNLLVAPGRDQLMITDFGIARIVGTKRLTATGMTVGTPTYMSPEQVFVEGELSAATDQYSLGVVACQLLAGDVPPMVNPSRWSARRRHASWRANLHSLSCPPALAALVERMVHPAAGRRWPDLGVVSRAASEIATSGEAPSLAGLSEAHSLAAVLRRLLR